MLPLVIAGSYILFVHIQALFRYDNAYFTPQYQKRYDAPSTVAVELEKIIRTGDFGALAEITGLRKRINPPKPDPNIRLTVLMKVDDAGYFHYLYFDTKTYERSTFYVKKVMGRYVMVPQDAYFYLDSGQWKVVFGPLATIWWVLLGVTMFGLFIYRAAAKFRNSEYHIPIL